MFIYKITNNLNKKVYIGLTKRAIEKRWYQHKYDCKNNMKFDFPLYRAMRKHGIENFQIEEVYHSFSIDDLKEKEQHFIKVFNSFVPNGYNATVGGEYTVYSDETRKKMSEKAKSRKYSEEYHQVLRERLEFYRLKLGSEKQIAAMKKANTGRKQSAEIVAKRKIASLERFNKFGLSDKEKAGRAMRNIEITCSNGKTYKSLTEASQANDVSISEISKQINGKLGHCKGLKFRKGR